MNNIHTDISQINDFKKFANNNNLPDFDVSSEVKDNDIDNEIIDNEPSPEIKASDMLGLVLQQGFKILAPAWNITDDEVVELVSAYEPVLDKYGVNNMQLGVEFQALIVTAMIFSTRIGTPRKIKTINNDIVKDTVNDTDTTTNDKDTVNDTDTTGILGGVK